MSNLLQISVNSARRLIPHGWATLLSSIARFIPSLQHYRAYISNGDTMYLDLRENMCFGFFFDGCQPHESGTEKLIQRILKAGDVVVDIGANIGYYTRMVSRIVGVDGSVLAVEPMPTAFRILQMNCADLSNVTLFNLALNNQVGEATFYVRRNGDTSSLSPDPNAKAVQVKMTTLDDMLAKYSKVDFIKIDVEGFELEVLYGSQKVISKCKPIVYFELLHGYAKERGFSYEDFKVFFSKFDYVLKWIDHSDSESILFNDNPSNMVTL